MDKVCRTNGKENKCMLVTDGKARKKEATRNAHTTKKHIFVLKAKTVLEKPSCKQPYETLFFSMAITVEILLPVSLAKLNNG
jgi:hypothetical protein